jgi:hypothetical protein
MTRWPRLVTPPHRFLQNADHPSLDRLACVMIAVGAILLVADLVVPGPSLGPIGVAVEAGGMTRFVLVRIDKSLGQAHDLGSGGWNVGVPRSSGPTPLRRMW